MNEADKPYQLTFEERPHYLYVRITAPTITEPIAMSYLREISDKCSEIKCKRLLLHRDIPEMLPDGVLFFVAAEFQRMIAGIKTAFVNPYMANESSFNFAVTVGTNRGADYGTFNNDADAEAWLLKD
jgi:hypothetical protein